jgi:hypothetical protein
MTLAGDVPAGEAGVPSDARRGRASSMISSVTSTSPISLAFCRNSVTIRY